MLLENLVQTSALAVQRACEISIAKCVAAGTIVVASITLGDGNAIIFVGIMMLCFIDFVTAIARDKKLNRVISSQKAVRTPIKIAVYAMLVSAGFITQSIIGISFLPIASIISGFIAVTELISVLENVGQMGYVIPKKLLNMLKDYENKQ